MNTTKKYNFYTEKYEKIKSELSKLEDKKQDLKVRRDKIKIFIEDLKNNDKLIDEFDEKLWHTLVQKLKSNTILVNAEQIILHKKTVA